MHCPLTTGTECGIMASVAACMCKLGAKMTTLRDVYATVQECSAHGAEHYELSGASVVLDQVCRALVHVVGEGGVPLAGIPVQDKWPGGEIVLQTNANGDAEFFFGPEAKFWPPAVGPHQICVLGLPCDIVGSLGLPLGHHADYQLIFVHQRADAAPPCGGAAFEGTVRVGPFHFPFSGKFTKGK